MESRMNGIHQSDIPFILLPVRFVLVNCLRLRRYSTVTDLARLRGWSTSQPRRTAMW
jgi:hypothetical protein